MRVCGQKIARARVLVAFYMTKVVWQEHLAAAASIHYMHVGATFTRINDACWTIC